MKHVIRGYGFFKQPLVRDKHPHLAAVMRHAAWNLDTMPQGFREER